MASLPDKQPLRRVPCLSVGAFKGQRDNHEYCNLFKDQQREPDKARRYLDLLDTARCNGRWEEVPELARKVEKYVPHRKCLALTARVECQIVSESVKRPSTPSSLIGTTSLSHQIPVLLTAAEGEKSFPEDVFEAQVCLGWLHWTIGEPRLALSRIPSDIARTRERLSKIGRALSGWTHVSIVKGAYIRGVSQEHAGSFREAVETYESLISYISNAQSVSSNSYEHRLWTEKLLSRYCVLIGRHVKSQSQISDHLLSSTSLIWPSSILPPFRAWAKLQALEPEYGVGSIHTNETTPPRRRVWQIYYDTVSILMQLRHTHEFTRRRGDKESEATNFDLKFLFDSKLAQFAELQRVETAYETVLLREISFPKANEPNTEVEKWVDQVMSNWVLVNEFVWRDEDLQTGGKPAVGRRVLAILYRAATRSFHSTRILRHLFTVHTALAEFNLAGKALNTYFDIVARGKARVGKSGETVIGLDDDSTALWTAAAGIRMLCVHGRREEAERAQDLGRLTRKWLEQQRTDHIQRSFKGAEDAPRDLVHRPTTSSPSATGDSIAAAYRALGVSDCCWSRFTYKPAERGELQGKAISRLQIASQQGLGGASNLDTLYCLALAHAEKRDIDAAIESVRSALSASTINPDDSSEDDPTDDADEPSTNLAPRKRRLQFKSWHLLSLLLTAKHNFDAAVESCEAALELYGGSSFLCGDGQPAKLLASIGIFERRDIAELKMTQLALMEIIDGPEEAVNAGGELLSLYAKLFQYTEPPTAKISPVSTASRSESANSAPRSIRASVFGRSHVFGSSHRKSQLAMGANGFNSTLSQISPLEARAAPTIPVSSDSAITVPEPHHHHHVFGHGSKKLHKRDSRKTIGTVQKGQTASPTRLSTAKITKQPNLNMPTRSPPSTANSPNQRSADSDPYASDEVGVAVSYNEPSTNYDRPAGLDGGSSAVASPPPTSRNKGQNPGPTFPKPSATRQDPDSLRSFIEQPPPVPEPIFDTVDSERHSLTLLVKIWCLMAALYRRASMPTDAAASLAEAETHVRTIETLVVRQNGSSNATLTTPGWAGVKAAAELWADVLSEQAMLHLSKDETSEATQSYEKALLWWPDHLSSTVGLCNLLLDSYEAITGPKSDPPPSSPFSSSSLSPDPISDIRPLKKIDSTEALSRLAARDRAYGLLAALTKSGQGWDCSEAWMALARAHELGGQVERAKEALWWVVELEEGRGVREWSVVGGW